jgi:hypothetical protein
MNIDQALRAAAEPVPSRVAGPAARTLLDDIVSTDPTTAARPSRSRWPAAFSRRPLTFSRRPVALSRRPRAFSRRPLRLAVAGSALALVAAAVAVVNGLSSGRAYASWTPDPAPLPASAARSIVDRCVPAAERSGARVAIGEARGRYAFLDVLTAEGSRTCFRDHDGRVQESSVLVAPARAARLGRTGIELYGWSQLRTDEGYVRLMSGRIGSQIGRVDLVVTGRNGSTRTVHTTVRDNFFAAWYPEGVDEASTNHTTLTLTMANGTTESGLPAAGLLDQPRLERGSGE